MDLRAVFAAVAEDMKRQFNILTAQHRHRGLRGGAREEVIRDFLAGVLPPNIEASRGGEVVDYKRNYSSESDIILYDRLKTPLFYSGKLQLLPAEPVYAIVEVKSILDGNALSDTFKRCTLAKSLEKSAFFKQPGEINKVVRIYGKEMEYFPILFFALAGSAINRMTVVKALEEDDERSGAENSVDAICSIGNEWVICWWNDKDDIYDLVWSPGGRRAVLNAGEHTLGLFYIMLHRWLSQATCRPFSMLHYFGPGDLARRIYPA